MVYMISASRKTNVYYYNVTVRGAMAQHDCKDDDDGTVLVSFVGILTL